MTATAPLTLGDLNHRVAAAKADLAWYVAACIREDGEITEVHQPGVRRLARLLDDAHDAAVNFAQPETGTA